MSQMVQAIGTTSEPGWPLIAPMGVNDPGHCGQGARDDQYFAGDLDRK